MKALLIAVIIILVGCGETEINGSRDPFTGTQEAQLDPPPKSLVIFDGDSLTVGQGSSFGHDYPSVVIATLEEDFDSEVFAISGQTAKDMLADASTQIDPLYSEDREFSVYSAWAGTNDLAKGLSPEEAYAAYSAACKGRRTVGFKVVAATIIDRQQAGVSSSFTAGRLVFNQLVRANWVDFADELADLAKSPKLSNSLDLVYFLKDHAHLTNAGYLTVAQIFTPRIHRLIRSPDNN